MMADIDRFFESPKTWLFLCGFGTAGLLVSLLDFDMMMVAFNAASVLACYVWYRQASNKEEEKAD